MINKGEIITSEGKEKSTRATVNMFTVQERAREIKGKENRKSTKNAAMITLRSGKKVTSPIKLKAGMVWEKSLKNRTTIMEMEIGVKRRKWLMT